jgi:hypothetical protein
MCARFSFVILAFLLFVCAGCSSDGDGAPEGGGLPLEGDDRAFVPEGLANDEIGEQPGGLTLVAFTLAPGVSGLELYAAIANDGDQPACEIGMIVEFYDKEQRLLTSAGVPVHSGGFFRLDDGSGTVISCLPEGRVAMAALTELPPEVVLEELGSLKHNFPAFEVSGAFLEGVRVGKLTVASADAGSTYRGTLTNLLEVTLLAPRVTVFPVNRVGRPLGVATSMASTELPSGGSWTFETSPVRDAGVAYEVIADGSVSLP